MPSGSPTKRDQECGNETLDTITDIPLKHFTKEDRIGFIILVVLYSIQGIAQIFFARTIQLLFIEQGAHVSELSVLSLALMPYSFKFLVAPFMDTYFFKGFGKRKTYIIPMQYIFSLICILMSYTLMEEIKGRKVMPILFFGTLSNVIMAIQDVAVDGWAISILNQENVAYGALAQTVGLLLGGVIAFNIFIPLNSVEFCNKYIFSLPQTRPLITVEEFWMWVGFLTIVVTILVHFFKKEKPVTTHEGISSVWDVIKTLQSFVKNPNLRQLVLVMITGNLTTAPIYAIADTKLLQKGFSKETLTNINTALLPVQMVVSILVSKFCKRKMEMRVKKWSYIVSFFNFAFSFWVVLRFDKNANYNETLIYIVFSSIISIATWNGHFVANSAYANRICDESISGTFLTTFAALANLGNLWPRSISLYLNESISWEIMGLFSLIATPIYFVWYQKQLEELHKKTPEDFATKASKSE